MASSGVADPISLQISNITRDSDPQVSSTVVEKVSSNGVATVPESVLLAQKPSLPELILEWGIKILGLAAAVVFGVWAPISYQATADGNNSSDAAQSSMMSVAMSASYQANTAMSSLNSIAAAASSQASIALDALNSHIVAIGQLWLYEFCAGQTVSISLMKSLCDLTLHSYYYLNVWPSGTTYH